MLRKQTLLFCLICTGLSALSLSGCKKDEGNNLAHLSYGYIYENDVRSITDLKELNYEDLVSKVSHEESFILALYNSFCDCWREFGPVLTEYINKYHVNIDYIEVSKVMNKDEKYGLYTVKGDMPSIAIFKDGKLLEQQVYGINDTKIFKDISHFETYVNSKVLLPKMYYAEKAVIDSYISSNKTFNLYVARRDCPDCQNIDKDVLKEWNKETTTVSSPLYILDIQDDYAVDPGESGSAEEKAAYQAYLAIKDKYGLSYTDKDGNINNADFGYGSGSVPTFQRREGNQIKDMAVFLNDSLDRDNKVIKSYFTTERVEKMNFLKSTSLTKVLNGMSVSDEDIANWRASARDNYYKTYHYPLAKEFISTYIK